MGRSGSDIITSIVDGPLRRTAAAFLLAAVSVSAAPAIAAPSRLDRLQVPVLIFHHVKAFRASDDAIERGLTIAPAQFEQELAYLGAQHFYVLTAAQVVTALAAGRTLPGRPVVLTFDDGYSDMATHVVPELRRHHMKATFFIAPGLLGKPRYLTWGQVVLMAHQGMDIEAHTVTHPDLTLVPLAQARGEIIGGRKLLQSRLHRTVRLLAYPYGDFNAFVLQTVRRAGYLAAFTTHQGWWLTRQSLLTLPRVYVDNDDTLPIFAGRLSASPSVLAQDPT